MTNLDIHGTIFHEDICIFLNATFWISKLFTILHNKAHSPVINIPIIMLILTFALEVDLLPQECTETINLITFPSLLNIILYYLLL